METVLNIPRNIFNNPNFKAWINNTFPEVEWKRKIQDDRVTLKSEMEIDEDNVDNLALRIADLLVLFPTMEIKGSFYIKEQELEINFGSDEDGLQTIEYFYGEEISGYIETEVNENGDIIKRKIDKD